MKIECDQRSFLRDGKRTGRREREKLHNQINYASIKFEAQTSIYIKQSNKRNKIFLIDLMFWHWLPFHFIQFFPSLFLFLISDSYRIYRHKYLGVMVAGTWLGAFCSLIPTWRGKWGEFGLDRQAGSCSILPDKDSKCDI